MRAISNQGVDRHPTVLLAEDEPGVLYTFKTILEEAGFQVQSAADFDQAQKSMQRENYDAVITDFGLGQERLGLELAKAAKRKHPAPAVLIYSGHPTVESLRAALKLRVDYFAFKPVDLDEIKGALSRLVARRAELLA
jgi:DNA-binding NtrC family response regulator